MAERGRARHAVLIGVFEFRRSVRDVRRDSARLVLLTLALVFPSVVLLGFLLLFAGPIRDAGTVDLPAQARGSVALLWLFGAFVAAQRVASARPRVDGEALVLTTVSSRTAAFGYLIAEALRAIAYVGLPAITLTAGLVFVFGTLAPLVTVPLAVVTLTSTAVVAGAVAGYAVAWLVATTPFVARHRTVLGGVAVVVAMGAYALTFLPGTGLPAQGVLAWLPTGWLADLAVAGTSVRGSPARAAGALVVGAAILLAGGAIVDRETAALWFVDPVSPEEDTPPRGAGSGSTGLAGSIDRDPLSAAIRPIRIPPVVPAPTRRVAEWALLRTRRDPRRLTFLLMPVIVAGSMLVSAGFQAGTLRSLAAPLLAVVLPWLAGGVVGMNPLGDEGAVLPVALTSISGRRYVRGLLLPGVLYGAPTVVIATAATGAFSPYAPARVVAMAAVGGFLAVVATALAPAVGMLLPRFSAIRVGQSRAVLPPRLLAVAVHLLLTVVPGAALVLVVVSPTVARGVVAVLVGHLPGAVIGLLAGDGGPLASLATGFAGLGGAIEAAPVPTVQLAVGAALIAGGVAVATGAYRFAVRRFERYEPA